MSNPLIEQSITFDIPSDDGCNFPFHVKTAAVNKTITRVLELSNKISNILKDNELSQEEKEALQKERLDLLKEYDKIEKADNLDFSESELDDLLNRMKEVTNKLQNDPMQLLMSLVEHRNELMKDVLLILSNGNHVNIPDKIVEEISFSQLYEMVETFMKINRLDEIPKKIPPQILQMFPASVSGVLPSLG